MSPESSGEKPDSNDNGPASAQAQARVASAWGAARNALAGVHNLEALLRSSDIENETLLELIPELRLSAGVLREAFRRSHASGDKAALAAGDHGERGVDQFEALLDAIVGAAEPRLDSAARARALADSLEAATDLLALLDRAAAPVATEVSLSLLARESNRMATTTRGREIVVQFSESDPDGVVVTDPAALGPLLSLLVAIVLVQVDGDRPLVLRVEASPRARFLVEIAAASDAALPALSMRVMPWTSASYEVASRVAGLLGASIEVAPGRAVLALGRSAD